MDTIDLRGDTHLLVLTGAGVSAESGIPTFRDSDGLWSTHPVERVASVQGFKDDPGLVWQFYSERRAAAKAVKPNAGHLALARLEAQLGDRLLLTTQNIDGLHQAAGSHRALELHGSLWKSRCSRCDRPAFHDEATYQAKRLPGCGACHARGDFALLRPHIVWFGEHLDPSALLTVEAFVERAQRHRFVFLAVGTSGLVFPAAQLVDQARARGAETWLVNLKPAANDEAFEHVVLGPSGTLLPLLLPG